jgi:hypothetical protein
LRIQALAALESKGLNASEAEAAISAINCLRRENFAQKLSTAADHAV